MASHGNDQKPLRSVSIGFDVSPPSHRAESLTARDNLLIISCGTWGGIDHSPSLTDADGVHLHVLVGDLPPYTVYLLYGTLPLSKLTCTCCCCCSKGMV